MSLNKCEKYIHKNKNDVNMVLFTQSITRYNSCKRKVKVKIKSHEAKRVCKIAKWKPHDFWANVNIYITAKNKGWKHCQARTFSYISKKFLVIIPKFTDLNERDQQTLQQMTDLDDPDLDSEIT